MRKAMFGKKAGASVLLILFALTVEAESLYVEDAYIPLAADHRGFKVGDSVTVIIVENASAKSATDSAFNANAGFNLFGSNTDRDEKATLDFGYEHDKGNSTQRQGELTARISVFVKEVDKRGQIFVEGKQLINVNGKEQVIAVSGWLRPYDISPNNTVLSTRLVDANIAYTGYKQAGNSSAPRSRRVYASPRKRF